MGEDFKAKTILEAQIDRPVHIKGLEWSEDSDEIIKKNLKVDLEVIENGKKYAVTVDDKEPFETGNYHGILLAKTDFEEVPEKSIDVRILVNAEIQFYPNRLLLPEMSIPEGTTKSFEKVVTIIAKKGDSLRIKEVIPSREDIVTTVTEIKPGKAYRCKLTIRPESKMGEYRGTLKFVTNYPGYEEVVIEIIGRVNVIPAK